MDSRASWFSRSTHSRRDRHSDSSHELPRWRSPSPMAASMIPPPIVQSTYMLPSTSVAAKSTVFEQPVVSDDREEQLHADLQFLLDAQADGLMKGLEGGGHMDGVSTGSTTPTARSMRSTSAQPTNRPIRRKPGLRSARKGLYSTIVALSRVKQDELGEVAERLDANEVSVAKINAWEKKRQGLREASSSVDGDEETVRAQRLQQEADALQASINEAEIHLADMKSRHRKLTRQIAAADNAVQAKLASYTQSMKMLEADIQAFLNIQPPKSTNSRSTSRPTSSNGASVWQLPPQRRTLSLAREQFTHDRESTLRSRSRIQAEKSALDDGAKMWMDVAVTVTEFEKRLRAEMTGAAMTDSNHAWDEETSASNSTPTDRLRELLGYMDSVINSVQAKLDMAEEKNWKLLIAAIGAEVEALRQGRMILRSALGEVDPGEEGEADKEERDAGLSGILDLPEADSGDEIRELDKSFETARRRKPSNAAGGGGSGGGRSSGSGDTDDDPDPELLFSREDSETD